MKGLKLGLFFFLFFFLLAGRGVFIFAQSPDDKLRDLREKMELYQKELEKLQGQSNSLANEIAQFDARIRLTELKIEETEEEIALLSGRIDQIQTSLDNLNTAFKNRVSKSYKMFRVSNPLLFVISAPDLGTIFNSFKYLQRIQESDRELIIRLVKAQDTYNSEKNEQERLQNQLRKQRELLNEQRKAKSYLLQITKNDEKRYQQLLAQARAEYEAIQAIIAGKGEEVKVGHVNEGERIASVIQGSSCNSSGSHLHFIVKRNGVVENPFLYLAPVSHDNCSGSSCGSGDGDPFNPSGSWSWPIEPPIRFMQGYGDTWAVRNTWVGKIYRFHNGIDINSDSSTVKAVKSGTLYRGSYNVGCILRYIRLEHDEGGFETLYLHINY